MSLDKSCSLITNVASRFLSENRCWGLKRKELIMFDWHQGHWKHLWVFSKNFFSSKSVGESVIYSFAFTPIFLNSFIQKSREELKRQKMSCYLLRNVMGWNEIKFTKTFHFRETRNLSDSDFLKMKFVNLWTKREQTKSNIIFWAWNFETWVNSWPKKRCAFLFTI